MKFDIRERRVYLDFQGHDELNAVRIALDVLQLFARLIEDITRARFAHHSKLVGLAAPKVFAENGERIEKEVRKRLDERRDEVSFHDFKFDIGTTVSNGYANAGVLRSTLMVVPALSMNSFKFELAFELYDGELTLALEAKEGEVVRVGDGLTLINPNGGGGKP